MAEFNIKSNISQVTGQFSNFAGILTGGVTNAIKTVNVALATLAANPIGAVVAALGVAVIAVTAGLSKLQPVVDRIEIGVARLGAAFSFVVDTVGSWLGLNDAPALSFNETADAAGNLARATQDAAEAQIALTVRSAELRAEQRQQLLISADQTLSSEERITALRAAQVATEELFELQRVQLAEEVRILETQLALGTSTREERQELADLQARLIDLDANEASALKEVESQLTGLQKTEAARVAAETKAAADRATRREEEQAREDEAAQKEVDRIREIRQEREIDLLIAGGATEEEVFEARLERAESEEERAQIMHEQEIARIEGIRDAKADAAEQEAKDNEAAMKQMERDEANADKLNQQSLDSTEIANRAKQDSNLATAEAAVNALTSLLGDSKGAMIAGLVASNAFEVAQILTSASRGSAAATASAAPLLANPITAGPAAATLAATQAAIAANTTTGLVGVGIATAAGIAGILSAPGEKPSGGGGGGGTSASAPQGPTVATPETGTPQLTQQDGTVTNQPSTQIVQPTVLLTPTSGPGSLEASTRANNKRNLRRRL